MRFCVYFPRRHAPSWIGNLPRIIRDPIYKWHNTKWIDKVMDDGRLIIDSGPDGRPPEQPSAWRDIEQKRIAERNYERVERAWDDSTSSSSAAEAGI